MRILYWNCRSAGNCITQNTLSHLCYIHKPDVLCLAEPMVHIETIPTSFWRTLNLQLVGTNIREDSIPSIWIFAKFNIDSFSIISNDSQQVTVNFTILDVIQSITFVYANVSYIRRRSLWDSLHQVYSNMAHPWSIMGDFNAVMGAHEKTGPPPQPISCREFRNGIDSCNFTDIDTKDAFYTWSQRRRNSFVEC